MKIKAVTMRLDASLHREAADIAALLSITFKELAERALVAEIAKHYRQNGELQQAVSAMRRCRSKAGRT